MEKLAEPPCGGVIPARPIPDSHRITLLIPLLGHEWGGSGGGEGKIPRPNNDAFSEPTSKAISWGEGEKARAVPTRTLHPDENNVPGMQYLLRLIRGVNVHQFLALDPGIVVVDHGIDHSVPDGFRAHELSALDVLELHLSQKGRQRLGFVACYLHHYYLKIVHFQVERENIHTIRKRSSSANTLYSQDTKIEAGTLLPHVLALVYILVSSQHQNKNSRFYGLGLVESNRVPC